MVLNYEERIADVKEKVEELLKKTAPMRQENKDWLVYVSTILGRAEAALLLGHDSVECTTSVLIEILQRHVEKEKSCI